MNNESQNTNQFDSNSQPQYYPPQYQYPPQQYPPQQYYVPQYAVTYIPYGLTPETFEERRQIKKSANVIGGSLLIMLGFVEIILILLRYFLKIFGLNEGIWDEIFSSTVFSQYLQAILSISMFTLPFIFLYKLCGYRISPLISFKRPKRKEFLPYYLLGVGVCYFANYSVNFASQFFKNIGVDYEVNFGEDPKGILGFMLTFIAVAIVPAFVEEFACRGLILGLLRKFGDGFAVLSSAILFGVMHGNFEQMPFAFIVGLVLGFITVKANTIWIAIAVHFTNNAVSVIIDYLRKIFEGDVVGVFSAIVLTSFMLLISVAIFMFKENDKVWSFKTAEIKATTAQVYKWFFTAPTIIIFNALMLIESMAFFI